MGTDTYVAVLKAHGLPCALCQSVLGIEPLAVSGQALLRPEKRKSEPATLLLVRCGILAQMSWISVAVVALTQAKDCPGLCPGTPGHEHEDCVAYLGRACAPQEPPDS